MRRSRPRREGLIRKGLIVVKRKEPMVTVVDDGYDDRGIAAAAHGAARLEWLEAMMWPSGLGLRCG